MRVERVNLHHSDLDVVNAARVSFDKSTDLMRAQDHKLITYLATHDHWSPFAHPHMTLWFSESYLRNEEVTFLIEKTAGFEITRVLSSYRVCGSLYAWIKNLHLLSIPVANAVRHELSQKYPASMEAFDVYDKHRHHFPHGVWIGARDTVTLRITAPIFVARQLVKHQVGFVWNEVSRRYVDDEPEFYKPDMWRERAENVKQGSSDQSIHNSVWVGGLYDDHVNNSLNTYKIMLHEGVAPEQARMSLPLSTMTSWWWTGTPKAWTRMLNQRLDPHAQKETRDVAILIQRILCQ